ncbi:MAG: PP2C family protein-serine/threonine phosphatase [Acidobacteriota bacterium]
MTRSSATSDLVAWSIAGLIAVGVLLWATPRLLPLAPEPWTISRHEAHWIALERLRALGEPIADAYVVERVLGDIALERRLQIDLGAGASAERLERFAASQLGDRLLVWEVAVYAPGAQAGDWTDRAWISLDGMVTMLRRRGLPADPRAPSDDEARRRALEHLRAQGFDPTSFTGQPTVQRDRLPDRERVSVRFAVRERVLDEPRPHGFEVVFEGAALRGFQPWLDDPAITEVQRDVARMQIGTYIRSSLGFFLLPLVAIPFLRRYHEGLLGVRRGVQIFLVCCGSGVVFLVLYAEVLSAEGGFGFVEREQTTWLLALLVFSLQLVPYAATGMMAWSTGESYARGLWPQDLASVDALLGLRWSSATMARAALRGVAAGLVGTAVLYAGGVIARRFDVWPTAAYVFGNSLDGPWPGVVLLTGIFASVIPLLLVAFVFLPAWIASHLGGRRLVAALVAYGALVALMPMLIAMPLGGGWVLWAITAVVPVLAFYRGDLLSGLLACVTILCATQALQLVAAEDVGLQVQGWAVLLAVGAPLWASLRSLGRGAEIEYTWDDVPPHVRRIAERERQRVELETAREIQSSILPDVPPRLAGVELAHCYLPASEVGGDFYDVQELADGRLAVAIGDVAGHGVSSGLVMSMVRAALAVQLRVDPSVDAVVATLNHIVVRSARRRLLSTLLYAVVDPHRGIVTWASAGHVYPYRLAAEGGVEALESAAYPLGVRDALELPVRDGRLAAGDSLVLYSDGLVEARAEGSDELFGFERLERTLRREGGRDPAALRDAVLDAVDEFTQGAPQEDDLTVLVLRLPAPPHAASR